MQCDMCKFGCDSLVRAPTSASQQILHRWHSMEPNLTYLSLGCHCSIHSFLSIAKIFSCSIGNLALWIHTQQNQNKHLSLSWYPTMCSSGKEMTLDKMILVISGAALKIFTITLQKIPVCRRFVRCWGEKLYCFPTTNRKSPHYRPLIFILDSQAAQVIRKP